MNPSSDDMRKIIDTLNRQSVPPGWADENAKRIVDENQSPIAPPLDQGEG